MNATTKSKAIEAQDMIFHECVVTSAELHMPIRFESRTETNITKLKLPGLKKIRWSTRGDVVNGMPVPEGMLIIEGNREIHIIPGANVKGSVI